VYKRQRGLGDVYKRQHPLLMKDRTWAAISDRPIFSLISEKKFAKTEQRVNADLIEIMNILQPCGDWQLILEYAFEPAMTLMDWIEEDVMIKYYITDLASNPYAMELIYAKVDFNSTQIPKWEQADFWRRLSQNPNAIDILVKHPEKINWNSLCTNPGADYLLAKYPEKVNWEFLSENSGDYALDLLEKNLDKVDWCALSENPNPRAIALLKRYPDKIDWCSLANNLADEAVPFIFENLDNIWKGGLCENPNPNIVRLIINNRDAISPYAMYCNRNPMAHNNPEGAGDMIEYFRDKREMIIRSIDDALIDGESSEYFKNHVDYSILSTHPGIFEFNHAETIIRFGKLISGLLEVARYLTIEPLS
jgi:hypothetical protein